MPTDIKMDTLYHDIDLTSGSLALFEENTKVVAQRVKIAVLTKMGEWFKDVNHGIPYYQEFFIQKNNKEYIDSFMVDYINNVQDVKSVTYYNSFITNRALQIRVSLTTQDGDIITLDVEV